MSAAACYWLVALAVRLPLPMSVEMWLLDRIDSHYCETPRRD